MKVAVVGPGAMGSLFGGMLSRGGHEVWMIDCQAERARTLSKRGIWVSGVSGEFNAPVHATTEPDEVGSAGLVLIAVKAYDTGSAAQTAQQLVGEGTTVLTLQNGLGNVEVLARHLGSDRVVGGVTSQGATLIAPGQVRHAGYGNTIIGEQNGDLTQRLRELAAGFAGCGIHCELTDDLESVVWGKLAVNAGVNAVATLAQVRNGGILESASLRGLMRAAVQEAAAVAEAKGIHLPEEDMPSYAEGICQRTADNVNSMLQDVHRRRRTEVDALNAAVVEQGRLVDIPTPTNAALTELIRGLEQTYEARISH
ncbi:MAG: 2-dehydropantoate 2-reductase [Armatimonadetes bacterium]|nr:2-dehydropantoate 2-reductase [Armatimonadota bacterium]